MKGIAITSRGLEDTAKQEIKELIKTNSKLRETYVTFNFKKYEDLCLLCYKAQSVDKILLVIDDFKFKKITESSFERLDLENWVKSKQLKIECLRVGKHDFRSVDVAEKLAKFVTKKYNGIKISNKDYNTIVFVYIINDRCFVGIDFAGIELNKRAYKIFMHPNSLRGTISYALIRESGFDKKKTLVDPFSRDGIIPIEAAIYSYNFPLNYYKKDRLAFMRLDLGIDFEKFFVKIDKQAKKIKTDIYSYDYLFKFVDYAKKNAKIAGVDKQINFSRVELEWLDIKFKGKSVDIIATNPPTSKNANLDRIYNEFFYQSDFILKDKGKIVLASKNTEIVKKYSAKHNFIIKKEKDVWSGEQLVKLITLQKKTI